MKVSTVQKLLLIIGFGCFVLVFEGILYQLLITAPNWNGTLMCILMMITVACTGIAVGWFIWSNV